MHFPPVAIGIGVGLVVLWLLDKNAHAKASQGGQQPQQQPSPLPQVQPQPQQPQQPQQGGFTPPPGMAAPTAEDIAKVAADPMPDPFSGHDSVDPNDPNIHESPGAGWTQGVSGARGNPFRRRGVQGVSGVAPAPSFARTMRRELAPAFNPFRRVA